MSPAPCPVLILTGDLGAGKTTLINALLAEARGRRVVVIENEAGEIGIDAELVTGAAEVLDLPEGCACCTVRGALSSTLAALSARSESVDLLVVELSGLADPVPVVQCFQEPAARAAFGIAALVGVAAATGPVGGALWRRQLRFADVVVMTKQLAGQPPTDGFLEAVHAATARWAGVLARPEASLERLLGSGVGRSDALSAGHDHGPDAPPETVTVTLEGDVDGDALDAWLTEEIVAAGRALIRVKGIVAVAGSTRRYVIQVAHGQWDAYHDRPWLGPRGARLVFIGHDLDRAALQARLERCGSARATRSPLSMATHESASYSQAFARPGSRHRHWEA